MPNKSDSAGKLHQFYSCLAFTQLHKNLAFSSPLQNQEARNFHVNCLDKSSIESLIELGRETAKLFDEDVKFKPTKILDVGEYAGAGRIDETCDVKISNEDQSESYSLKCGKGSLDQILSRNMGSKSLLEKYFDSKKEQQDFKTTFEFARMVSSPLKTSSGPPVSRPLTTDVGTGECVVTLSIALQVSLSR